MDGWEDNPKIADAVKHLTSQQAELLEKIGPERAVFSRFLAQIQGVRTYAEFESVVERLITEKTNGRGDTRYHVATFEEAKIARNGSTEDPLGWFKAFNKTYAPFVALPGDPPKLSGQKAVEAETCKAARRCRNHQNKVAHQRTKVLLADTNVNWTLKDELAKDGGFNTGLFGHKFKNERREGVLVVRISRGRDGPVIVEPWDGSGDFIRFSELRVKFSLPLEVARRGRITRSLETSEMGGSARLLASLLNEAVKS